MLYARKSFIPIKIREVIILDINKVVLFCSMYEYKVNKEVERRRELQRRDIT